MACPVKVSCRGVVWGREMYGRVGIWLQSLGAIDADALPTDKMGIGKLIRAVGQLARQTMVEGRKTVWFIAVNSKTMHVTCSITMEANSSANQRHFSIFAPPAGNIQKHAPITWLHQRIVHLMNIGTPGWHLEGRALWERVLVMGSIWVMVWWLNVEGCLKYMESWRRLGLLILSQQNSHKIKMGHWLHEKAPLWLPRPNGGDLVWIWVAHWDYG